MQLREQECLKTLEQRVKIFNAYLKDIKTEKSILQIRSEVYNSLNKLHTTINNFSNHLTHNKSLVGKEILQVNKRIRTMGKMREYTAGRIDIFT